MLDLKARVGFSFVYIHGICDTLWLECFEHPHDLLLTSITLLSNTTTNLIVSIHWEDLLASPDPRELLGRAAALHCRPFTGEASDRHIGEGSPPHINGGASRPLQD